MTEYTFGPTADLDAVYRFEAEVRAALRNYGSRKLTAQGAIADIRLARDALDRTRTNSE